MNLHRPKCSHEEARRLENAQLAAKHCDIGPRNLVERRKRVAIGDPVDSFEQDGSVIP